MILGFCRIRGRTSRPEGPTEAPAARSGGGRQPTASVAPASNAPPAASGGAEAQVATITRDLMALLHDGEAQRALRLFNREQVEVLGDDELDVFYTTLDKVHRLERVLAQKFSAEQAAELMKHLRGTASKEPSWEVLDAGHATVSPNLVGPVVRAGTAIAEHGSGAAGW